MEETLNDQPFLHAVVWECCDVFLKSLPGFQDGFIRELLKLGDLAPNGIRLAHWEVLGQECIRTDIRSSEVCFIGNNRRRTLAIEALLWLMVQLTSRKFWR